MTLSPIKPIPRLGVAALSSPLEVGADRAEAAAAGAARRLEALGCHCINAGAVDTPRKATSTGLRFAESHVHAVVLVAACWFEDYLALDLIEECPLPLVLWGLPGMETGALCGTQQLSFALRRLGHPYTAVFGAADDVSLDGPLSRFAAAAALHHRLRRAKIGLAGHAVYGMSDASVCELALKKSIGPRIVPLDVPSLLDRAGQLSIDKAREVWGKLVSGCGGCNVGEGEGIDSMRILAAFEELIARYDLDALAVGCYPHLMGRVCLAASVLADRGIPLGCEGDVGGTVGQLILTLLTGQPTHNTDWLEPLDDGTVVLSHCGSGSFRLAESPERITLSHVRLMDQGVCALFPGKPGPVTLVNLVPKGDTYQLAVLEGEAVPTDMVFPGNPTRVRFERPTVELLEWIYQNGLGHHWMIGYGHVRATIERWTNTFARDLAVVRP